MLRGPKAHRGNPNGTAPIHHPSHPLWSSPEDKKINRESNTP